MLVVTRRRKELIVIDLGNGEQITVRVVDCGGRCKLGIEAPQRIVVLREELVGKERTEKHASDN